MATTEGIAELPTLPQGSVQGDDILPIVDVHDLTDPTGTTKGVTLDASLYRVIPRGTRTVATLGAYLNDNAVFNVKDYGAVGNGSADDTAAINLAITAATTTGGIVFLPVGVYLVSTQLVLPAGVSLVGAGQGASSTTGSRILWTGASDFCLKCGNTAGTLSVGIMVRDIGINIQNTNASGIWLYGVKDCLLHNLYIEGQVGTATSIGVQIDGANISAFFILMQNVTCNHVFKGFVHTTTGTTIPTQVTGINCSALCDNTANSIGVDVQNVAGSGCGDGATYLGGNMEHCATGVKLAGSGTSIIGMRFENPHGTSSDITFDTLARCNQVIGGANVYTLTNTAANKTNQLIVVPKDQSGVVSQMNLMDSLTLANTLTVSGTIIGSPKLGATSNLTLAANGTASRYIISDSGAAFAGVHVMQAGDGSASHGGAVNLYGASHATHPGDVVAGISSGSGGKFRVNSQGLDGGTDWLSVGSTGVTAPLGLTVTTGGATVSAGGAAITGNSTVTGSLTVSTGFGCNGATAQTAMASGGAAPAGGTGATAGAYDTAAHRDALITLVNNIRTCLVNAGLMT